MGLEWIWIICFYVTNDNTNRYSSFNRRIINTYRVRQTEGYDAWVIQYLGLDHFPCGALSLSSSCVKIEISYHI
ncbi:hypothetical protein AQUCO_02000602v1 [Aquilegia coerulea]|uniref:Uncharacterized protein n=1 Tax=Aquilegia coerulea TaxID=218851 RepID=A0A2G5DIC7_AQUCA|nr:hypothetical protein AQUCO_02000602v1 [Aquilegia coerulea]